MNEPSSAVEPRHGRVIEPFSRGSEAVKQGLLGNWQVNEMEGGKNFPDISGGPFPDPYGTDTASVAPPEDGLILSGGKKDARDCVNFTAAEMTTKLGRPFTWQTIKVKRGETFKVKWEYTAPHTTRGYRWFITKEGWDPEKRITRAQLDAKPFCEDFYTQVPFNKHEKELVAKVTHEATLPTDKYGRHVIVLAWIVANTGNAFYQAFDVDFQ